MTDPVAQDPLDQFVALSAILTGVAADKLHPTLDTYGTAREYLAYATANAGAQFAGLMRFYAANSSNPDVGSLVFNNTDPAIAYMAKTVMLMWYLGAWYPPDGLQKYHDNPQPPGPPFLVISADAYTQGWAWRVGQTHPMGYSDWRFGYWHSAPPPLSAFIGA